jgi:type I restriction enzyme, S subunit
VSNLRGALQVSLGDVCRIEAGAGFPIVYQGLKDQEFPFFKVGDMNTAGNEKEMLVFEHSISDETRKKLRAIAFPVGTIVFPKIGAAIATNKKRMLVKPSCVDNNVMALIPNKDLDPNFLFYLLLNKNLSDFANTGNPPSIRQTTVEDWVIPLPPLTEQKRIASLLARADRLRQLRRTAHELSASVLQSVFLEMFGDVKLNQKGWDVFPLEEIVKPGRIITYGIVQAGPHIEDGIPYIRTGDIKEGQIIVDGLLRTSKEIAAKYKRSEVKAGELVMSIRATVGTIAELPPQLDGANLTQGTARISPGSKVNKKFLLYAIRSQGTQKLIEDRVKGATFREITLEALREVPMIVPPLSLQEEFAGGVARVESLRGRMGESERQVEGLFEALLGESFGGGIL